MTWNDDAYPPQSLGFHFGDRARAGDRRLLEALVDALQDRRWTVAAPAMLTRSAKAELPTYTIRADRRHDDPSAELRALADVRWLADQLAAWSRTHRREVELELDDEPVGWIVRGDVDAELTRFLDRWERDLKDHAAADQRRAAARTDRDEEGRVSVWLGDLPDRAALDALLSQLTSTRPPLARELGVDSLDEDTIETHWAPRRPVPELLTALSFGDSFVAAVIDAARGLGIAEASTVVALYDHDHQPGTVAATARPRRLRFIGSFAYDAAADSLAVAGRSAPRVPAALAAVVEPWRHYYPRLHEYQRTTDDDLAALERALGASLPASYRPFLLHLGGAHPTAGRLRTPIADPAWTAGPVEVDGFEGFRRGGRGPALDPHGRIPFDLLPIADTPGGDRFCLGIAGHYRDQVWLWSHDRPRPTTPRSTTGSGPTGPWLECLYVVAPTFDAFLAGLELVEPASDEATAIAGADHAAAIARSRVVARSMDRVARPASSKTPTVIRRDHAVPRSRFGDLAAHAPDLAITLLRGVLPAGDADHADVPAAAADVVHVLRTDAEIRNGGIHQLIGNHGRASLQRSRSALRAMGAMRAATILQAADDRVGDAGDAGDADERASDADRDRIDFDDLDQAYEAHDPPIAALVADHLERRTEPWFDRLADSADAVRQRAAVTPQRRLRVAIELGAPARVRDALAAGASVQVSLDDGTDALHLAVRQQELPSRLAVTEVLLDAGAAIDRRDERGHTILHGVAAEGSPDTVRLLLARGADPTSPGLLHVARCAEITSILLAAGANPRALDAAGRTPLHFARDAEQVDVLLAAGTDPRVCAADGQTALHHDVEPEVVALLASLDVEVDSPDAAGRTPLMFQHREGTMAALIERGARIDTLDKHGRTLLHHHHSDACTALLLGLGADPLHRDHAGRTPLDLARAADYYGRRYVDLLERAADIEPPPPPNAPPEPPPTAGPLTRIATLLLARLVDDELVELDDDADRSELADALADAIAGLPGKAHPGTALARWLLGRDEIAEVFGSDEAMAAALRAAVAAAT